MFDHERVACGSVRLGGMTADLEPPLWSHDDMRYVISYSDSEAVVHSCANQRDVDTVLAQVGLTHIKLNATCDLSEVSLPLLTQLYNQIGTSPVKRFRNRAAARHVSAH
jgi:hypothetical protein